MLERLLLAAIATFCFYLFCQVGNSPSPSPFFGENLVKTPTFFLKNLVAPN
ncbi:MAG: hypothetical protein AB4368_22680 [Xenococcaceae cyanobacterium]